MNRNRNAALTAIIAAVIASASACAADDQPNTPTETPSRQTATAPDVTRPTDTPDSGQPTRALPIRDGDWQLTTLTVKQEEYTNQFTGRARIRYMGEDQGGGTNSFTITVFVGGKDVATLQGVANDVKPGRTVTVDLFSTDHYVPGRRSYTFQKEL